MAPTLPATSCSVTQTLIHESSLQLDTIYLTTDIAGTTRIDAIVSSICEIFNLESGIRTPTDTATIFADTPRASCLPRSIASDILKETSTRVLDSEVGTRTSLSKPAFAWSACLRFEAVEGFNQEFRAGGTGVKLGQLGIDFAAILVCDSIQERLLHLYSRNIEILAVSIHREGTVQVDDVSPLAFGRGVLCKAGDGVERLQIVQSVDSQVFLDVWKFIHSKPSNVEPYRSLSRGGIGGHVAVGQSCDTVFIAELLALCGGGQRSNRQGTDGTSLEHCFGIMPNLVVE